MKEHLRKDLKEIEERMEILCREILEESPCRLFATLRDGDDGRCVRLSGNSEGLVYFANILLGLATEAKPGQHFHFGVGEVLDEADRELILQYKPAEWD